MKVPRHPFKLYRVSFKKLLFHSNWENWMVSKGVSIFQTARKSAKETTAREDFHVKKYGFLSRLAA
jgi:hypothetical protein